jgi:hypothetical protein
VRRVHPFFPFVHEVPAQDLRVNRSRMPALPRSGFLSAR